ncbi:protein ENHANCED DISEASE RESISTANCE 2-like isoform X3 [Miscanthus floridulus]|uniref:protein ENHANCED DISEASE RESISTANCE 2-like isoform X3 n=1 Tax=Miscanthus floridulus TaxID=154761 RepID=UPI00345A1373
MLPRSSSASCRPSLAHGAAEARKVALSEDEESEDDDDYQVPEADLEEEPTKSDSDAKSSDAIDLSWFSGIICQDTNEKSRNCWAVPNSKTFKVRSKTFPHDKSKVSAGKYLDHVARRKGSAAQVAADKGMFTFLVNIQVMLFKSLSPTLLTGESRGLQLFAWS